MTAVDLSTSSDLRPDRRKESAVDGQWYASAYPAVADEIDVAEPAAVALHYETIGR